LITQANYYSNQSLSVHLSISRLSYSLFFCFEISFKTAVNSICLRTCLSILFRLCFKAGAKVHPLFRFASLFGEFFNYFSKLFSNLLITQYLD